MRARAPLLWLATRTVWPSIVRAIEAAGPGLGRTWAASHTTRSECTERHIEYRLGISWFMHNLGTRGSCLHWLATRFCRVTLMAVLTRRPLSERTAVRGQCRRHRRRYLISAGYAHSKTCRGPRRNIVLAPSHPRIDAACQEAREFGSTMRRAFVTEVLVYALLPTFRPAPLTPACSLALTLAHSAHSHSLR